MASKRASAAAALLICAVAVACCNVLPAHGQAKSGGGGGTVVYVPSFVYVDGGAPCSPLVYRDVAVFGDSLLAGLYGQWMMSDNLSMTLRAGADSCVAYHLWNRAVSGLSTTAFDGRYDFFVQGRDFYAVIVEGGINDMLVGGRSAAQIFTTLSALYGKIRAAGIRLIIVPVLPFGDNVQWTSGHQTTADTLNASLAAYAAANPSDTCILPDAYAEMEDPADADSLLPAYTDDGLHLTEAGSVKLAELAATCFP